MSITVIDPGLQTRVVSTGRLRSRSLGVPIGGPADRAQFALANALVGNRPDSPGLEIAVKGPTLRAAVDVGLAIVGAPFVVDVGGERIWPNQSFTAAAGREIFLGGTPAGVRGYLALAGGIDGPEILGSRDGVTPLRAGDVLSCRCGHIESRRIGPECPFLVVPDCWRIRIVPGPQRAWFADDALSGEFTVSSASDRMGVRLEGSRLEFPARELVSEPVSPGAIQVTRDGQPIILGVDGQTIGGYPKVAHVIDADLDLLAQMRSGEPVCFQWVTFAQAEELWRFRQALLNEWRTRIEISLAGP